MLFLTFFSFQLIPEEKVRREIAIRYVEWVKLLELIDEVYLDFEKLTTRLRQASFGKELSIFLFHSKLFS